MDFFFGCCGLCTDWGNCEAACNGWGAWEDISGYLAAHPWLHILATSQPSEGLLTARISCLCSYEVRFVEFCVILMLAGWVDWPCSSYCWTHQWGSSASRGLLVQALALNFYLVYSYSTLCSVIPYGGESLWLLKEIIWPSALKPACIICKWQVGNDGAESANGNLPYWASRHWIMQCSIGVLHAELIY
jgi:hypothetical protein